LFSPSAALILHSCYTGCPGVERMLLPRMAADDGAGRPCLIPIPRLLVGLAAGKCASECEWPAVARSPTSPLDLWAFLAFGGALARSPRSWDSHRVGLGVIVDDTLAEAEPAAGAPRNLLLSPRMWPASFKLPQSLAKSCAAQPRDCARPPAEVGKVEATASACSGGVPVPCSKSYGDLKSGPEPILPDSGQLGASSRSASHGKFPAPGSLLASIGGPRRCVGSISATEVEQSEDYTYIIAHGPNPKTTRIFGDCILEPVTVVMPDSESTEAKEGKEAAESNWLVKCSDKVFL
jgi:hypothetical protein